MSGDPPPSSKSFVVAKKPAQRGRSTIRDQKSIEVKEEHRDSATELDRISEAALAAGMSPEEFRRLPRARSRDDITQLGMERQNQHERATDPGGDPEEKGQTVRLGQLDVAAEIAAAAQDTPDMPAAESPARAWAERPAVPEPPPSVSPESEPTASYPGELPAERSEPGSDAPVAPPSRQIPASLRRSALTWVILCVAGIVGLVAVLRALSGPPPIPTVKPAATAETPAPTATAAAPATSTTATAAPPASTAAPEPPPSATAAPTPSAPRSAWPSAWPSTPKPSARPSADRPDIDWQ